MKTFFYKISFLFLLLVSFVAASCSDGDYLNAVPDGSKALVSIDLQRMSDEGSIKDKENIFKEVFNTADISSCGIDLQEKIYFFVAPDGNLGLCAKVDDEDALGEWLEGMNGKGITAKLRERRGYHFTVLKGSWVVGFSDKAMLVMGPVVESQQPEVQGKIAKYIGAEEEDGIKGSKMFGKLDSIPSAIAMVAQAEALPEQFTAPFTLGAPKDADASQILIAAEISSSDGSLDIKGETFSFNRKVDEALRKAAAIYRPIEGKYVASMPKDAVAGMFVNVDGKEFLPLMQTNKGIQALLMGVNAAIDMDNIIRSVDGDMAVMMPRLSDSASSMMMSAQLSGAPWLDDVDYWKKSCPKGGRIADWGRNAYYYTDGKMSYYFGVSDDNQYYSGSSREQAENSIKAAASQLDGKIQAKIRGQKLVMLVNMSGVGKDKQAVQAFTSLRKPLFGSFSVIVYTLK